MKNFEYINILYITEIFLAILLIAFNISILLFSRNDYFTSYLYPTLKWVSFPISVNLLILIILFKLKMKEIQSKLEDKIISCNIKNAIDNDDYGSSETYTRFSGNVDDIDINMSNYNTLTSKENKN